MKKSLLFLVLISSLISSGQSIKISALPTQSGDVPTAYVPIVYSGVTKKVLATGLGKWTASGSDIYYTAGIKVGGSGAPTEKLEVVGRGIIDGMIIKRMGGTSLSMAIGVQAGTSTGDYSTAVGYQSQTATTVEAANTSVGYQSLKNNTGFQNVAIGHVALLTNTTGSENTAIGTAALYLNTTSYANTAVGNFTLSGCTTGAGNTSIGKSGLAGVTTGQNNTSIGLGSGSSITTGSYNVVIGTNNGSTIATLSNRIIVSDGQGNIRISVDNTGLVILATSPPDYADNAAAVSGGLVVGTIYRTGDALKIVH